jgi:hypothetical protein
MRRVDASAGTRFSRHQVRFRHENHSGLRGLATLLLLAGSVLAILPKQEGHGDMENAPRF